MANRFVSKSDESEVIQVADLPLPKEREEQHELHHVHIEPSKGWINLQLRDLWTYRELLYFLAWRDIKIRYKQTFLGVFWAILQPFLTMVVFSVFFGNLAKMSSEGLPYPIFNFAGLLPYNFFSQSINTSSNSLVGNSHLITKVYFPRLIIPISSVLSGLVDFGISFLILIGLMIYYAPAIEIGSGLLLLPVFLLLALITSLGVGLWLSALNVQYRDVRYIVPFIERFWLFITPVVYPSTLLDEPWRTLYGLNPMVGVVEGFRWALLGTNPPNLMILVSAIVSILVFISGLYYFRRMEKTFADVV